MINVTALKIELEKIVSSFDDEKNETLCVSDNTSDVLFGGIELGEYSLAKRLLADYFEPPKPKPGEIWFHKSGLYVTYVGNTSGVILKTSHAHQKVGQFLDTLSILSYPEEWRKV